MHEKILQTIAEHTPYSYEECKVVYDEVKSYDVLLAVLDLATTLLMSPATLVEEATCKSTC